jgi:hypothetical protein
LNIKKKIASARPNRQAIVMKVISVLFKTTRRTSFRSVSTGIRSEIINDIVFFESKDLIVTWPN